MVKLARSIKTETAKQTALKVVAAIPCYNTEHTIVNVVANVKKYVEEVIVIDDGSMDMTAEVAHAAGARVISHKRNLGKGAAMKTAAENTLADIIVFIDGDGQHNPDDIPGLLAPILQGKADYVIGSRYLANSHLSANPFLRKAANAFASFIISFIISVIQPLARFIRRQPLPEKSYPSSSQKTSSCSNYRVLNGQFKWVTDCTVVLLL